MSVFWKKKISPTLLQMKHSSIHSIHLHERELRYTLHRKRGQRNRYIRIKNGELIVSSPYMSSIKTIEEFLRRKSDWILKHIDHKPAKIDLSTEGAFAYLLGKRYAVKILRSAVDSLEFKDQKALFSLSKKPEHKLMMQMLQDYYKAKAPSYLLPRTEVWIEKTGLRPSKISFRKAKSRWGSCSSRNTLSFNIYTMMLPAHLIDYIIIHELSHIKHKNHGESFWDLVGQYAPDWKSHRKELRRYEPYLV